MVGLVDRVRRQQGGSICGIAAFYLAGKTSFTYRPVD